MVDGELIEGGHAALVDEATWQVCANVRSRNQRRTSNTWTRHNYPLTPLRMHGEVSKKRGHEDLYYACNNARRNRSGVNPQAASSTAKFLGVKAIEDGIREELKHCLPTGELHETVRDGLREAVEQARRPETLHENAIRRLDVQLDRICRLFELGEYDEETFILKRSEIKAEQEKLREQAKALRSDGDTEWCRVQLFDVLTQWDAAEGTERTKLLSGLFERIEAHVVVPETFARKFRTKRVAETIARRLAARGHKVEWVRRN